MFQIIHNFLKFVNLELEELFVYIGLNKFTLCIGCQKVELFTLEKKKAIIKSYYMFLFFCLLLYVFLLRFLLRLEIGSSHTSEYYSLISTI